MKLYPIFILLIIISSCKDTSAPENTLELIEIPEEFVSFYQEFHTDSIFQMQHIVFPLRQKSDSSKWQESEWVMHTGFSNTDSSLIREFDNFKGIIIESIRDRNNAFMVQRRFAPSDSSYNLIYYEIKNKLNWETNDQ